MTTMENLTPGVQASTPRLAVEFEHRAPEAPQGAG